MFAVLHCVSLDWLLSLCRRLLKKKQKKTTLVLCFRGEAFLHSQPLWAEGQLHQHQAEEEPPRLRLHRGGRWRARWVPADQEPCPGWTCSAWWQDGNRWVSWIYWGRRFFHSVSINGFVKGLKGVWGGECAAGLHACFHSGCSQNPPHQNLNFLYKQRLHLVRLNRWSNTIS